MSCAGRCSSSLCLSFSRLLSCAGNGVRVSGAASASSVAVVPPGAANPSIHRASSHGFAGQIKRKAGQKRKAALIVRVYGSILALAAQPHLNWQQLCCNVAFVDLHAGCLKAFDALIVIAAVCLAARSSLRNHCSVSCPTWEKTFAALLPCEYPISYYNCSVYIVAAEYSPQLWLYLVQMQSSRIWMRRCRQLVAKLPPSAARCVIYSIVHSM